MRSSYDVIAIDVSVGFERVWQLHLLHLSLTFDRFKLTRAMVLAKKESNAKKHFIFGNELKTTLLERKY